MGVPRGLLPGDLAVSFLRAHTQARSWSQLTRCRRRALCWPETHSSEPCRVDGVPVKKWVCGTLWGNVYIFSLSQASDICWKTVLPGMSRMHLLYFSAQIWLLGPWWTLELGQCSEHLRKWGTQTKIVSTCVDHPSPSTDKSQECQWEDGKGTMPLRESLGFCFNIQTRAMKFSCM